MSKRSVSESVKKRVAGKQGFKCATILEYKCPLYNNDRNGIFGEEGYEIDHILELSNAGSNDISNLQALCLSCHRVKTKRMVSVKKVSKKEEKEEKEDNRMDVDSFISKFQIYPELKLYKGLINNKPIFEPLEKNTKYNLLKDEIYFIPSLTYKKRGLGDQLFSFFFPNIYDYIKDNKGFKDVGKFNKRHPGVNGEYDIQHFGDFLQNLNKTFKDRVNFKKFEI